MVIPEKAKEWINKQRTRNLPYEEVIKHDFDLIKEHLPFDCHKILDIGCGIGGIDVYLSRKYNFVPRVYLFDFMHLQYEGKIQYGFNEEYRGYNSYEATLEFIKKNGIENYEYINADFGLPVNRLYEIEIVISLLSLGYHYPVETYIDQIISCMSEDGVFIADIRQGTDGIKILKGYFKSIEILASENKADKIIARGIKW